jgi:hypothetical protein
MFKAGKRKLSVAISGGRSTQANTTVTTMQMTGLNYVRYHKTNVVYREVSKLTIGKA